MTRRAQVRWRKRFNRAARFYRLSGNLRGAPFGWVDLGWVAFKTERFAALMGASTPDDVRCVRDWARAWSKAS